MTKREFSKFIREIACAKKWIQPKKHTDYYTSDSPYKIFTVADNPDTLIYIFDEVVLITNAFGTIEATIKHLKMNPIRVHYINESESTIAVFQEFRVNGKNVSTCQQLQINTIYHYKEY